MYIIIGVVVGLGVLALILGLTLGGGSDDPNPPTPPVPPVPPTPSGYNPYFVDKSTFSDVGYLQEGIILTEKNVEQQMKDFQREVRFGDDKQPKVIDPRSIPLGINNQILKKLKFQAGQVDYTVARVVITDADNERFTPPSEFVRTVDWQSQMRLDMCGFQLNLEPFSFSFSDQRGDQDEVYLTTKNQSLLVMDKYLQMDFLLSSQRIYGFGERNREFSLGEGTWTMWANGQETPYDDGLGGKQVYGVHPFALVQTKTPGQYFGVYFRNTNAQSPVIQHKDDGTSVLSYITTGGQLDIFFFFKGSAKQIIQQYQSFIGLPSLPPFWALGWHQASYGYKNIKDLDENVQGYQKEGIPLEVVWVDIPYMDNFKDFSVNSTAFPQLDTYVKSLHSKSQRFVPIVDAGISADDPKNVYWRNASENNLLIKSTINDDFDGALATTVWPKHTVFLDFFSKDAANLWAQGLTDLHKLVPYDGLWLDMNEIASFCNGECPEGINVTKPSSPQQRKLQAKDDTKWYQSYTQDSKSTYFLPFIPGQFNFDNMTMSLNATHPSNGFTQYNTHSLFGLMESKVTRDYLTTDDRSPFKNNRTFILSRSTFAGSGVHAAHWLGDNHREWAFLNYSIAGIMNFNMFGIPFVGPDTCGFFESRYESDAYDQFQLCGRWIQLSTFHPFARHHRDKDNEDGGRGGDRNEPWLLPEPYKTWAKNAIFSRLQYVRQLYTCLFGSSTSGQTCFDPLLFHFPEDESTFSQTEHSFIYANAVKVSPVLSANVTEIFSYFPAGTWVSLNKFSDIVTVKCQNGTSCYGKYGEWRSLPVSNEADSSIHSHLMPGAFIAFQNNSDQKSFTTQDILSKPVSMIANRDRFGHAQGRLFLDDGFTLSQLKNNEYEHYEFQLSANSIKKWILNDDSRSKASGIKIDKFVITNAEDLKNTDFACVANGADYSKTDLKFSYSEEDLTLTLQIENGMIDPFTMRDIYFGRSDKDINLCAPVSDKSYYHTKDFQQIDLTKNSVEIELVNSNPVLQNLNLEIKLLQNGAVNVFWNYKELPAGVDQPFRPPKSIVDPGQDQVKEGVVLSDYVIATQEQDKALKLQIKSKDGTIVYQLNGMVLSQYYNYISGVAQTAKGSKGIMGLFERTSNDLFLKDGVYSLWSRDIPNPIETGKTPGNNLYGTHPVFFAKATDNTWFGVYSNLAAAQDWWIKNSDSGNVDVTSIATGGTGDLYIFFGSNPNELVTQYHNIIGKPVLVPQWALGWNQCRWGYNNVSDLTNVVNGYKENNLPLDTQWSDIDYLDNYKDFTHDPVNFKDLPSFVENLHKNNMHYIPILDIGLAQRGRDYEAYTDGVNQDVFIKSANKQIFTGKVWPGDAVYPDFFAKNTATWWKKYLSKLHDVVPFDGLWEDMNEASNFCDGVCYASQMGDDPVKYKLPYIPTARDLEIKSISLDAVHGNGYLELDTHSLIGTQEVQATHDWFIEQGKRPLIIERSSFTGMGKFASRWLGDNFSNEQYMGFSVVGIQAHSIMGIALAGSDICGFIGNTNPELCARWHIVGAFYPFSRNHNDRQSISQEPYVKDFQQSYDKTTSYMDVMELGIKTKYRMIRYYYTEMSLVSRNGGVFYKPLFFEFPNDAQTYNNMQYNVMLGQALKLSVLSDKLNQNTTDFYFPAGTWCNVIADTLQDKSCETFTEGKTVSLPSKAWDFYLHLRAGYIIPMQNTAAIQFSTSADLQRQPVDFHVHPACNDQNCQAQGRYLNDDGVTLKLEGNQNLYDIALSGAKGQPITVTFTLTEAATNYQDNFVNENDIVSSIQIYNAKSLGFDADHTVKATMADGSTKDLKDASYNKNNDRLVCSIIALNLPQLKSIVLTKK